MSAPTSLVLQRLHGLDRSSSEYHAQIRNVLYEEEYQKCVPNLEEDDLIWLVGYLDKVRRNVTFPHSRLKKF